jgi:hypothetical protein
MLKGCGTWFLALILATFAVAVPSAKSSAMSFTADRALRAEALRATGREARTTVAQFQNQDLSQQTQKALNALVSIGVAELQKRGYSREAGRWSDSWNNQFANYFDAVGILNLGDHAPLSRWLVGFYNDLEAKLGKTVCEILYLDDLRVFNYAIPVVFNPLGLKGDHWDMVEYRKHFVPFAAATTYWAGQIACGFVTNIIGGVICSFAAVVPRYAMQDFIAPSLSDFVFNAAHGVAGKARHFDIEAMIREELRRHPQK